MPDFSTADTIINDAAVELGLKTADLSDPFASADGNIVILCRLLKRVGRQLVRARDWTQLVREYTFNTSNATASYALPAGFNRIKDATAWNRSTVFPVGPAVTSAQWQEMKARTVTGTVTLPFRIWGNLLYVYPTPTSVQSIYYEYVSSYWVVPTGQTAPTTSTPSAITDTLWFDEDLLVAGLKLAFLKRKGMATQADQDLFNEAYAAAAGADGVAPALSLSYPEVRQLPMGTLPDTGWGL